MTAEMSMNTLIHGAVRRDLARFRDAADAFPDGDAQRAAQLHRAWQYFYGELDYHHHSEHDIVWPALLQVGASPELLAAMDAEHEQLAAALKETDAAFAELEHSPTAASATAAQQAVKNLTAVAEDHLRHEEAEVEPIYAKNHDAPAVKAIGRKFAMRRPTANGSFVVWLQDGASQEQLSALRKNVPAPVVTILGTAFGGRYRREIAPVWRS